MGKRKPGGITGGEWMWALTMTLIVIVGHFYLPEIIHFFTK